MEPGIGEHPRYSWITGQRIKIFLPLPMKNEWGEDQGEGLRSICLCFDLDASARLNFEPTLNWVRTLLL